LLPWIPARAVDQFVGQKIEDQKKWLEQSTLDAEIRTLLR
jgi:hypothetical protein